MVVMHGNYTPTLRKLVAKVLSLTTSYFACERTWSTFTLIHTNQQSRLGYPQLQQLVFGYYNTKLELHDIKTENDKVIDKDYLDLLEGGRKRGESIVPMSQTFKLQ